MTPEEQRDVLVNGIRKWLWQAYGSQDRGWMSELEGLLDKAEIQTEGTSRAIWNAAIEESLSAWQRWLTSGYQQEKDFANDLERLRRE